MKRPIIVAIDGPAGVGKSTVARRLARQLKVPYVDTGAMYRAVALEAMRQGISWNDGQRMAKLARSLMFTLKRRRRGWGFFVNGQRLPPAIRLPEVTQRASEVAELEPVREVMVRAQRRLGKGVGAVAEGRDIGTVIFPKAPFKFYLTASLEERARRRLRDLKDLGIQATLEAVKRALRIRDHRDQHRRYAPLRMAKGALVIDNTSLQSRDVVRAMLHAIDPLLPG